MLRIAVFILSIIGIFFVAFTLVFPEFQKMSELESTLEEEEQKLATAQKRVANFQSVDSALKQGTNSEIISYVQKRLPKESNEKDVLNVLGQIGSGSGFFIGGLDVDEVNQDDADQNNRLAQNNTSEQGTFNNTLRVRNIPFSIGGIGSYSNVKQFLSFLQNIEREFSVSEVTIELEEQDDTAQAEAGAPTGEGLLSVSMDINFEHALAPLLSEKSAILESFEDRDSSQITNFEIQNSVFPEGGLNDLEYTSGGRENPYLPAS
jgi:Tfp pilus assembly protein PilO